MGPTEAPESHKRRKRKGAKERAKRKKGEEEKKAMVALLDFYHGYFGDSFRPKKKLLDALTVYSAVT